MSDTKPRPGERETKQIAEIHGIFNEYDGEEALKRIRVVLYGLAKDEVEKKEKSDG